MTKKDGVWLFACVLLLIALVVSIILGMSGFFSSAIYLKSFSDLVVGDTVNVSVLPNQTNVATFTFDGSYLPNEKIPQIVQISAQDLNSNLKVRVKSAVSGSEANFSFSTSEHFQLYDDGYYYYDDVLQGGNKITFCTTLVMPEESDFLGSEKYVLTIVVETLEQEFADSVWKMA